MIMEETTTIRVKRSTVKKLRTVGQRGQSDDDVINMLLSRKAK